MEQDKREKARLASKAYRDSNIEEYRAWNRARYWRDKEKKIEQFNNSHDLSKYPEEERKKVAKLIKELSIMRAKYPELLEQK